MTKQELIDRLLLQLEKSDAVCGDQVLIPRKDVIRIIQLLSGQKEIKQKPVDTNGKKLFYCMDCSRSFWAAAREDKECFEKWKYHTWYAKCPNCKREIALTDRYWR